MAQAAGLADDQVGGHQAGFQGITCLVALAVASVVQKVPTHHFHQALCHGGVGAGIPHTQHGGGGVLAWGCMPPQAKSQCGFPDDESCPLAYQLCLQRLDAGGLLPQQACAALLHGTISHQQGTVFLQQGIQLFKSHGWLTHARAMEIQAKPWSKGFLKSAHQCIK